MRKVLIAVVLSFAVTLAIIVGKRMSTEAMAVVVGVVCGVAAGIPMSVLIMLAVNRRSEPRLRPYESAPGPHQGSYPPVVVIQGGTSAPNGLMPPYYTPSVEAAPRQFHIVGEEDQ